MACVYVDSVVPGMQVLCPMKRALARAGGGGALLELPRCGDGRVSHACLTLVGCCCLVPVEAIARRKNLHGIGWAFCKVNALGIVRHM